MKQLLEELFAGKILSAAESKELMLQLVKEPINEAQAAACLAVFRVRGFTVDELEGFREALLELCVQVDLGTTETIDVCGTGGDHKDTFNISTITSFLLAAMGKKVAKHGNYAVSSACGSSNVLEALGVRLSSDPATVRSMFDRSGICFIHAPLYHPAMKRIAPLRKQLGVRTVFNAVGPLANPARPGAQLSGVYSFELQRTYGYLLQRLGNPFAVVHSVDGYDEVSLTSPCRVVSQTGTHEVRPEDFGFSGVTVSDLKGGETVEHCGELARSILAGNGTAAQSSVVAANAALALWIFDPKSSLKECAAQALSTLRSGAALKVLELCV